MQQLRTDYFLPLADQNLQPRPQSFSLKKCVGKSPGDEVAKS